MAAQGFCAALLESKRLERAKDLIADEQWARAIDELKAAVADPKEPNKDEALYWLAHSQNQSRDRRRRSKPSAGSSASFRRAAG